MWKQRKATNLLIVFIFVLTSYLLNTVGGALSDKRLCADEKCKTIISIGKGKVNYWRGEEGMVSFRMNAPIRIMSKSAGSNPSLWGVEVGGREGYAPRDLIREEQIYVSDKNLIFEVSVDSKKPVNSLSTSEKLLEQEKKVEATTTKPLNLAPAVPIKNPFNSTNDEFRTGSSPVVTPVQSDVVDGTKIPIADNNQDNNVKNGNENISPENQPINKNEDITNEYDEKYQKQNQVEKFQKEPKESSTNINSVVKESDDKISGKTTQVKGDSEKNIENLGEERKSVESMGAEEKRHAKVEATQGSVKKIEDGSSDQNKLIFNENPVEANVPVTANENMVNVPAADKTVPTVNGFNQKPGEESEPIAEKSQQTSSEYEEHKNHDPVVYDSTKGSTDVNRDNTKIDKDQQHSKGEEIQGDGKQEEKISEKGKVETESSVAATKIIPETSTQNYVKEENKTVPESDLTQLYTQNLNEAQEINTIDSYNSTDNSTMDNSNSGILDKENENYEIRKQTEKLSVTESIEDSYVEIEEIDNVSQSEEISENSDEKDASGPNTDKNAGVSNDSPLQSEEILETSAKSLSEKAMYEENSAEKVEKSVSGPNADKNVGVSNDSPLQSEEIPESGTKTPSEMLSEKTMYEENSAEKVEKSVFEQNADKNVGVSNNVPPQSETISETGTKTSSEMLSEKVMSEQNTNKNAGVSNDGPQSQKISERVTKIPSEVLSEKAMYEENSAEKVEKSVSEPYTYKNVGLSSDSPPESGKIVQSGPNTDKNTGLPNENPSQSEESLVSSRNTPDKVLNGKAIVKDNKYPYTSYIPSPKDLSSENKEIPSNTEEDKTSVNDVLTSEKTDLSETLNPNSNHNNNYDNTIETTSKQSKLDTADSYNDIPTISDEAISPESKPVQSSTHFKDLEQKENKGLFATIMGTVNNMLSTSKKTKHNEIDGDSELDRILFSVQNNVHEAEKSNEESSFQYCKNIGPNGDCPKTEENHATSTSHFHPPSSKPTAFTDLTLDTFLKSLASKILEISDLLAFLVIVAGATLFFVFGYYCFCNSNREGDLLQKLNQLESSLLASHKENAILKHNLMSTRQKLTSIEDNSFGSNDMVVSLKKELEEELMEKSRLQEQITVLQKELENAADAGIELNKIVSELLSSQTGDESIISSVEELQKQLNEQQNTIFEINASLAEKSRENSELQLLIAEQNARYEAELANVQRDNDELEQEKGNLITRLDEMKNDFDKDISAALEGKNMEIKRLQNEIVDLSNKLENEHTKWQTSVAKIEALEECLKNVRKDPNVNITEVINVANVKAQLIEIQKKYSSLREKFETESDSRKLAENQLEVVSAEVEKLKQDFNQSEKDKLEAQTRLEVLSNYFKDKENQLQKELSVKEAMWLKQQGETTTTVDRLTAMQEEIQSLKSLNDSLRAEIEAQVAAHKAQTGTLENRAHETWLAARQSDRRYEEARAEATALRRRLTALAGGNVNEVNKPSAGPTVLGDELTQAPSPIHMESPGSPMLGRMPPPPFLPPPFMGHPPPFIGMPPPPPFVPPGEMRPAPLGRIMSPPPQRSGRFSPQHLDYEDYLDYESNNTWHRHTYSPPPRTYRSLSPTDSRYDYGTQRDLMSTYDTETDFSPPPSPRESRRRGDNIIDRIVSNDKISYGNTKKFNTSTKGPLSSGSEKSFNTRSHNEMKATKGNVGGGGKTFV